MTDPFASVPPPLAPPRKDQPSAELVLGPRRRLVPAVLAIVVGLAAVGAIAGLLTRDGSSEDPGTSSSAEGAVPQPGGAVPLDPIPTDPSVYLDRARIEAFDAAPLLALGVVPPGFGVESGVILDAAVTVEGCDQFQLTYADRAGATRRVVTLYQLPVDCVTQEVPPGARVFRADGAEGWVRRDEIPGRWFVQVLVAETVVQVEADISHADVAALVASLEPFTFDHVPTPVQGLGAPTDDL